MACHFLFKMAVISGAGGFTGAPESFVGDLERQTGLAYYLVTRRAGDALPRLPGTGGTCIRPNVTTRSHTNGPKQRHLLCQTLNAGRAADIFTGLPEVAPDIAKRES
jgi:hypothetical protein